MARISAGSADAKKKTRKASPRKAPVRFKNRSVTGEEKHQLISQAAYYRAEQRGFIPGLELDDWLAAEEEINRSIQSNTQGKVGI